MYNDYWLQQIDGKINNTNSYLYDIIENQDAIILNQQEIISGDKQIIKNTQKIFTGTYVLCICMTLVLIYNFIVRSLK